MTVPRNESAVSYLNYLVKTYNGLTQLIVKVKQRLQSLPGETMDEEYDSFLKGEKNAEGLETVKGRTTRAIEKELKAWDIWGSWLKKIPGIGPFLAAELIIDYYYRFIAICQECGGDLIKTAKEKSEENGRGGGNKFVCSNCGKKAKGEGVLKYRIEEKDFATISKWWAYMGRHCVDGVMPKRKKGTQANWGTPKRTLGFHIGDQFNRQDGDHPYKKFMLERKAKHEKNHPEWSKGHRHNAARNETVKLFLAHFWTVARTLEDKPISEPYAGIIMGHTNIIQPFYWSDHSHESQEGLASDLSCESHGVAASKLGNREVRV